MKIDWKGLSKTKGYISLKKAYINDIRGSYGLYDNQKNKSIALKKFIWVICRAKHYSVRTDKALEQVLTEWEENRSYNWNNYYQDCNQPKLNSKSTKPRGIKGLKLYYKSMNKLYSAAERKHMINDIIQNKHKKDSKKVKKRWTSLQKNNKI